MMPPHHVTGKLGWIEVICGCMFSGKTEELIRRVRRAQYARQDYVVFKPHIDDRYSTHNVGSHSGQLLRSIQIDKADQILERVGSAQVVGIDEAQFLGIELVAVCETLANEGRRVLVAGLDQDFQGKPFEPIPQLLAVGEYISKMLAICTVCGGLFLGLGLTSAGSFSGGNIRIELGSIAMIALLVGGTIYAFIPAPKRLP